MLVDVFLCTRVPRVTRLPRMQLTAVGCAGSASKLGVDEPGPRLLTLVWRVLCRYRVPPPPRDIHTLFMPLLSKHPVAAYPTSKLLVSAHTATTTITHQPAGRRCAARTLDLRPSLLLTPQQVLRPPQGSPRTAYRRSQSFHCAGVDMNTAGAVHDSPDADFLSLRAGGRAPNVNARARATPCSQLMVSAKQPTVSGETLPELSNPQSAGPKYVTPTVALMAHVDYPSHTLHGVIHFHTLASHPHAIVHSKIHKFAENYDRHEEYRVQQSSKLSTFGYQIHLLEVWLAEAPMWLTLRPQAIVVRSAAKHIREDGCREHNVKRHE